MTQGYTCIFIRFELNTHIHEVRSKIGITSINDRIIKTSLYTCI